MAFLGENKVFREIFARLIAEPFCHPILRKNIS